MPVCSGSLWLGRAATACRLVPCAVSDLGFSGWSINTSWSICCRPSYRRCDTALYKPVRAVVFWQHFGILSSYPIISLRADLFEVGRPVQYCLQHASTACTRRPTESTLPSSRPLKVRKGVRVWSALGRLVGWGIPPEVSTQHLCFYVIRTSSKAKR